MSTPKKITQLTTKSTLDDNDKFVIVDSVANDNKNVTAQTIKNYVGSGSSSNILFFNFLQSIVRIFFIFLVLAWKFDP